MSDTKHVLRRLAKARAAFIPTVCSRVGDFMREQRKRDCLAVRQTTATGEVRRVFDPTDGTAYVTVLPYLLAGTQYEECSLDSFLADPIVELVCKCYEEFLEEHMADIEQYIRVSLAQDTQIEQEISASLGQTLSEKGLKITESKLIKVMHDVMSNVGELAAYSRDEDGAELASGTPMGRGMIQLLLSAIATHVHATTSDERSHAVLTEIVLGMAKKHVLPVVISVVSHMLTDKFKLAKKTARFGPVAWTCTGLYILSQFNGLPEEMATMLSKDIGKELKEEHDACIKQVLDEFLSRSKDPVKIASLVLDSVPASLLEEWEREEAEDGLEFQVADMNEFVTEYKRDHKLESAEAAWYEIWYETVMSKLNW